MVRNLSGNGRRKGFLEKKKISACILGKSKVFL